MASDKMTFVIELENGQYKLASAEVIKATEKMEKQAVKSNEKMENSAKKHNKTIDEAFRRLKRMFGIGALVGLAIVAINKFFEALTKNSKALQAIQKSIGKGFEIGLKSEVKELDALLGDVTGTTNNLAYIVYLMTASIVKLIELIISMPTLISNMGEKFLNTIKIMGNSIHLFNIKVANTASFGLNKNLKTDIQNIEGQNKTLEDQNKLLDQSTNKLTKKIFTFKSQTQFQKEYNAALKEEKELENAKKFDKAAKEYNDAIVNLENTVSETFGSKFKEVFGTFKNINDQIITITKSMEVAKEQGKEFAISGDAIFGAFTAIYNVISGIAVGLFEILNSNNENEKILEKINEQNEKYEGIVKNINLQLQKMNAALDKQKMIPNESLDAIDKEIKAYEELIKTQETLIATNTERSKSATESDLTDLKMKKKSADELIKEEKKKIEFFKSNPIGIGLNIIGLGVPLAQAEKNLENLENGLKILEQKIKDTEENIALTGTLADEDNKLFSLNQEMNELIKERTTLLQKQVLATADIEERLLNAKLEGTKTDQESADIIDDLILKITEQVMAYNEILAVTTDKNERLETEADIQEHLNQIADLRERKEEAITKQLENQINLLKKYVDLGLDLENIRVVKQLTKTFNAQGYSGIELGAQLQSVGVASSAIGGKVLNIYGDINNTLNQATPNMLIANMNSLINKIGGV